MSSPDSSRAGHPPRRIPYLPHALFTRMRLHMELVLRADVEKLGKMGEVVKVSAGYARNYLLPQKLAVAATAANVKEVDIVKKKAAKREEVRRAEMAALAEKVSKVSLTIPSKAAEEGHLYGSVTAEDIAAALGREGCPVEVAMVQLEKPIKQVDTYDVKIRLHPEIETTIKVWVVAE
ncbi:MAG: 50S ribosomal protein L9 [Planctomycetes bacterium]|nr:50S ribosomal protein L9 [Planctomycetota bacterium]